MCRGHAGKPNCHQIQFVNKRLDNSHRVIASYIIIQ